MEETLQSKFHQPFLQEGSFINWGSDGVGDMNISFPHQYISDSIITNVHIFSNFLDINVSWFLPISIYLNFFVDTGIHISLSKLIFLNNICRESDEAGSFDVLFCCIAKYQAQNEHEFSSWGKKNTYLNITILEVSTGSI